MKVFKAIWSDIRRGENLDLYPTVALSLVAFILSLLDVVSQKVVLSVILATLALVSVALLISRRQNESIGQELARIQRPLISDQFFKREDDMTQIISLIRESRDVWLWGSTLSAHLPILAEEIEKGLAKQINFRILLIGPVGNAISMAAFRAQDAPESQLKADLLRNLEHLNRIARRAGPGTLEIRVVDYLGPYVLYLYDPLTSRGVGTVRLTTFRGFNSVRPTFEITAERDHEWYGHFVTQFEQVWSGATPWAPTP